MTTVEDIVNFIDERKGTTKLKDWSKDQVCIYVWECINNKTIRVSFTDKGDGLRVIGVIIFNPNIRGQFWVNQFFGDKLHSREMWKLFLLQLKKEYPDVKEIWAMRHGNNYKKFSVERLINIYVR